MRRRRRSVGYDSRNCEAGVPARTRVTANGQAGSAVEAGCVLCAVTYGTHCSLAVASLGRVCRQCFISVC